MKAQSRHLFGEQYEGYEISIPADAKNPEAKLLEEAARRLRSMDVSTTTVSGIFWRESNDDLILEVIVCKF